MPKNELPKAWVGLLAFVALGAAIYGINSIGAPKSAPKDAVPAVARIVRSDDYEGTCAVPGHAWSCYQLVVDVYDSVQSDGGPRARTATVKAVVENKWGSRVQPGSWVAVSVDPKSGEVFLNAEAFAVAAPAPVAPAASAH